MSHIESTTTIEFQRDVLDAERPTLVDFWAPWCAPCRVLEPTLTRLAEARDDLRVVKVNVDDDQALAARYGVRGIPSLILFRNGEPAATHIGLADFNELSRWLEEVIVEVNAHEH